MTPPQFERRLAVLGLGKLGGILLNAFTRQGLLPLARAVATTGHEETAARRARQFHLSVTTDNGAAAEQGDVILICVKPHNIRQVCGEIGPSLNRDKLVISAVASVPTRFIEQALPEGIPVVRAMPNTPCAVGCGMTGLSKGRFADPSHLETTRLLFETVGKTVIVDDKHMNAVTGLSASGPAFVYIILESLAEAGVKVGLPREVATLLAAQTTLGASKVVLESGHHPALLKDAVTTPAGCTIDGILELEEGKLRVTLIKAVVKATQRAGELLVEE